MKANGKMGLKIGALALSVFLLICAVITGMIVFPQLREQGKRYTQTTDFRNRGEWVQMIAHRGLSGLALENTNEAFLAAAKRNFYGIETDVRITKDGKFILCHDENLQRIAALDYTIEQTDYQTLRSITFQDPYFNGEKQCALASVEEYFSICKAYEKHAVLELKSDFTKEKIEELLAIIKSFDYLENTTFISFSKQNLLFLREVEPTASAQYMVKNCTKADEEFMIENKFDANIFWASVSRTRVKRLHKAGLKVNCWTVDGAACATLMQDYGVDQITTNILE